MRETTVPMPVIALVAMTRGMLGAGLALLFADRLKPEQRRHIGWTLFVVGAVTTVPLAMNVVANSRTIKPEVIGGE
jgi:uncharacterized membrane protein